MIHCKLSANVQRLLCCPVCGGEMVPAETAFRCSDSACSMVFPVIDGVLVLLNEGNSIFTTGDFIGGKSTTFDLRKPKWKIILRKLWPRISLNVKAGKNIRLLRTMLLKRNLCPRLLVIGGSIEGNGMALLGSEIELVSTDVSFGPLTEIICDAHDLPFNDESFDGVVVQAVLEHVVDPFRCVAEIHRVLKQGGIVYADTPFMQQVHMGKYDFMRFTHLGHRRLFRNFTEIESGASCGTGMALAWAYRAFLWSFSESKYIRTILGLFASATSFWLKYLDYFLIDKPAVLDAASGYYFIGSKSSQVLTDADLLLSYKGMQR